MTDMEKLDAIKLNVKSGLVLSGSDCSMLLAVIDRLLSLGNRPHEHLVRGWEKHLPPPPEEDPLKRAMEKVERDAGKAGATLFEE